VRAVRRVSAVSAVPLALAVRAVRRVSAVSAVRAVRAVRRAPAVRAVQAWRLVGGFMCLLLLAGCGGSGTPDPTAGPSATDGSATGGPAGPVRVTLGIYSGRVDPAWVLTDAEAATLQAALAALPGAVGTPPLGGLGYRGFTISGPGGTVVAFRGAVAAPGDGERSFLADPGRTIERLLAETAHAHVTGNELAEVERALAAP
jgi:hypothetical protein